MKLNLDSQPIEVTCPGCGQKFHEKLGRLKHNQTLPCPGCGAPIRFDADQFRDAIQTAEKVADQFRRTLGKAFK